MLRWIDPEHGMARFYSLTVDRDLFGTVRLVRLGAGSVLCRDASWPRTSPTEEEAGEELERPAAAKRRRGYRDL